MSAQNDNAEAGPSSPHRPLKLEEYERYGRQMILPGWGLPGQLKLKAARIAVVGAGGLGCPVLQYLAGAGVGTIDIFDHDTVSASNLHRQVLHTTERVGMNKAESAAAAMTALNPFITPHPHSEPITPNNALALLRAAEIIVDCTDRPLTRYLLSDASVRLGVPLVSGAAISSAGQWAVYDDKGKRRACYRCIWPQIIPGSSGRCEDVGVWGVVTGMAGTGMAGEVIKLILGNEDQQPLLHLLHLGQNPLIRTIRLKPPSPKCIACGPNATITDDLDAVGYEAFCGGVEVDEETGMEVGDGEGRISVQELRDLMRSDQGVLVVDTRPEIEYEICSIPSTQNIPLAHLLARPLEHLSASSSSRIVFICKQGNDSRVAAAALRKALQGEGVHEMGTGHTQAHQDLTSVRDVRGGLRAWSKHIDPTFPLY
ncbi:putative activating enzyme URM1 [Dioszegia hungarica]|uniref:Activating enzyme URM1 n=1 Tax=Dioszegia hungarica TaxID=4972 RepID=A0AA38HAA7_9TREE|nr:putative activating enzyme URM1 [Dioszegia hungarica]KAI9635364.1 putative activating enzyme URM1 [Dioszegia hungarica]